MPNEQYPPQGRAGLRVGSALGKWTLVEFVKTGGNGDVWFVECGEEQAAVKVLHRIRQQEDYQRFRREVAVCKRIDTKAVAILPIIDDDLPEIVTKKDRAWFAMPRATPLVDALSGSDLTRKVEAVRDTAKTLAVILDQHGIHHRDVKPENLFLHEDRVVIGDFGLAKGVDDPDLTNPDKPVGPIHHLAPEIAVGDPNPDLERTDVYYLATTLWRLALDREVPPRGQIRAHEADSVARRLPGEPRITELAQLMERATARGPAERPSLRELAARLDEWITSRLRAEELLSEHQKFASLYVERENRNRAVLQWLIGQVRKEPTFDSFIYDIPELHEPAPDIPGLTEGQMAEGLSDLIEEGLISGEPQHVLGRREPLHFTHLYPSVAGVAELYDVEQLIESFTVLLRAFLDPISVTLPRSHDPVAISPQVVRTPAEAYFEMWLLNQFDLLDFKQLRETGGFATFMDVRATARGRRLLYELDSGPDQAHSTGKSGASPPQVFPAPDGNWGNDAEPTAHAWRMFLPVTNGGGGVALNVRTTLRWPSPGGVFVETVPTSLAPGESRNLAIDWGNAGPVDDWQQVQGSIHFNDLETALWETEFRIYADRQRHKVEVGRIRMIKLPDGTVIN